MKDRMSLYLVEDDQAACMAFAEYIDISDDFSLVGVTNNAAKAIADIQDTLPDAIILDLELHQGSGNGLIVLSSLQKKPLSKTPYIVVTTNNSSAITFESARQMGADFIMSKHQADYSEKGVLDFLRMMRPVIQNNRSKAAMAHTTPESPMEYNKRIYRRIMSEMDIIGISPKAVGRKYIIDAIQLCISNPVPNLCSLIGKKYKKTEASVERAMQNAINRAWSTADIDTLLQHYTARINSNKGVPTITEFVYYYANKLKSEY